MELSEMAEMDILLLLSKDATAVHMFLSRRYASRPFLHPESPRRHIRPHHFFAGQAALGS